MLFRSDTDNVWQSDSNGTINTNAIVGTGLIRFDADGNYVPAAEYSETGGIEVTRDLNGTRNPIQVALLNGAGPNFVQDLNFRYLFSVNTSTDLLVKEQDGRSPGALTEFIVSLDGAIHGVYNNGHTQVLGRLALAMVANENGLVAAGDNLYFEGAASGPPKIAMANTGGRGQIRQGQLEVSNVDLAEEFTKLLTTERGYQANARTISTVDEMLQELLNLKR